DLDRFLASRRNRAQSGSLEAIFDGHLNAPEHVLVMLTEEEEAFELESKFFRAAHARRMPMLKVCWWQDPDDVRRRLRDVGIPVDDVESRGELVIRDAWPVYRQNGSDGLLTLWADQ